MHNKDREIYIMKRNVSNIFLIFEKSNTTMKGSVDKKDRKTQAVLVYEATYNKVMPYCRENGLKMVHYVSVAVEERLKKDEKK